MQHRAARTLAPAARTHTAASLRASCAAQRVGQQCMHVGSVEMQAHHVFKPGGSWQFRCAPVVQCSVGMIGSSAQPCSAVQCSWFFLHSTACSCLQSSVQCVSAYRSTPTACSAVACSVLSDCSGAALLVCEQAAHMFSISCGLDQHSISMAFGAAFTACQLAQHYSTCNKHSSADYSLRALLF